MAGSVQKRDRHRWKARYRGPDGRERSKMFLTEREAKDWLALQTVDMRRGDWVDPRLAEVTVGAWGRTWLERKAVRVKPSTLESYRSLLETCVLPHWDRVPLAAVTFNDVDHWLARLSTKGAKGGSGNALSASRVRKAHVVLSQILDSAVKDGRLSKNPARGVDLPRLPKHEHRYLTHEHVATLAAAFTRQWLDQTERRAEALEKNPDRQIPEPVDYTPLVLVLAYCGMRFGEAAALRVRNVDLMRGRIRIAEAGSEINGRMEWGPPKTHAARSVGVPPPLRDMLMQHMAGRKPDDLVFPSPEGEALRNGNFRRRVWDPAVSAAGLVDLTPHALRHTAASMAVESGANVKAVQRMLGHASAAMTLDVYAELFDDSLDHVADRLGEAMSKALVAPAWPGPLAKVSKLKAVEG